MRIRQWCSNNNLTLLLVVILLSGLFISRALVSVAAVALLLPFLLNKPGAAYNKQILWGCCLIILPVLVSGFWSENTHDWWRAVEVKLPLLTIGLGLAAGSISFAKWRWVIRYLLVLTVIGSLWSVYQFATNSTEILQGYLQAKVMPTPFEDDHIRFSWLVVLVIILSLHTLHENSSKVLKICLFILVAWLVIYLHLLAAKTGLLCLYAAGFIFMLHKIIASKNWLTGGILIAAFLMVPAIAYLNMPSLHNRVQYVLYEFDNYTKGVFIPGSSDGARVLSIKAGWQILNHHPATGVGFGDLKKAINQWHEIYYSQSLPTDRFLPLNEWVLYGAASGWMGVVAFTAGIIMLVRSAWSKNIISKALCFILIIPMVTDDTLESQFGVVIFIFVLMVTRQLFKLPEPVPQ